MVEIKKKNKKTNIKIRRERDNIKSIAWDGRRLEEK
jgi:hypothetical protein